MSSPVEGKPPIKVCTKCHQVKSINDFEHYRAQCKPCRNKRNIKYYAKNKMKWPGVTGTNKRGRPKKVKETSEGEPDQVTTA